jgi:threonine dehydrogenase-like Zn-dependent dehydrogenase
VVATLAAAGPIDGRSLLVFGGGILGVTACALARSRGVTRIDVVEPNSVLHDRIRSFGAHSIVDASAISGQYDVALELSGSRDAAAAALEAVRIGGTVVFAGTVSPVGTVELDPEKVVRRLLSLRGIHNYHPMDLGEAIEFLGDHGRKVPFSTLFGQIFRLSDLNSAVNVATACGGTRILIQP